MVHLLLELGLVAWAISLALTLSTDLRSLDADFSSPSMPRSAISSRTMARSSLSLTFIFTSLALTSELA